MSNKVAEGVPEGGAMMSQLGELLSRQREELGLTLEDLQARTKIRLRYIEAIEAGEYDIIPGEVYVRGFIRNLADELGLDPKKALGLYHEDVAQSQPVEAEAEEILAEPAPEAKKTSPAPREPSLARARLASSKGRRFMPLLLIIVLVGALIVGVMHWSGLIGGPVVDEPDIPPPNGGREDPPPPPEPQIRVELENPDAANPVFLVDPGPLEVVLTAEGGDCWIGAKADNKSTQDTLSEGRNPSVTLLAESEIVVRVGNPAALHLHINGQDQGVLGGTRAIDLTIKVNAQP